MPDINNLTSPYKPIFIVGSPRSGTTLIGRILASHPTSATFFVPYFLWEKDFQHRFDDRLIFDDASTTTKKRIRREFARFAQHQRADRVIDQSPRNSLRIDFVRAIFPNARFIHVIRDGRDAALSIYDQWVYRRETFSNAAFNPNLVLRSLTAHMRAQPLLRHKLAALWFEVGGLRGPYSRRRWGGMTGWGPRFPGWQHAYSRLDLLSFAAEQWRVCNETAADDLKVLAAEQSLEMHYEKLLSDQDRAIHNLVDFVGLEDPPEFRATLPQIEINNAGKWSKRLSQSDAQGLTDSLRGALDRWGYRPDESAIRN